MPIKKPTINEIGTMLPIQRNVRLITYHPNPNEYVINENMRNTQYNVLNANNHLTTTQQGQGIYFDNELIAWDVQQRNGNI